MPKVSIVIPTLNRAHLLRWSLKSAIEQTYGDIEVIVSDDLSTDNTWEVVKSFNSKKIIYVKPDKRLNLPESFEFALQKASGEFLTFLTDDSYLLPDCIRIAMMEMGRFNTKLSVWRHCGYFDSDWLEAERRNVLYMPKVTGQTYLLKSEASLQKWFTNIRRHSSSMPRSINSLCHRFIIDKALKVQGHFFLPPAPDHSSGIAMLMNTTEYVLIDQPLVIDGVTKASIGPSNSFNLGESSNEFYKGFKRELTDITFLGIPTTPAVIAQSFENVRSFYSNHCPKINIKNMICEIVDSLAKLEVYGTNIDQYWKIVDQYAADQPWSIKFAVAQQKIFLKLKWMMVRVIRSSRFVSWLEKFRNLYILKGSRMKFTNIEECANIIIASSLSQRSAEVPNEQIPG